MNKDQTMNFTIEQLELILRNALTDVEKASKEYSNDINSQHSYSYGYLRGVINQAIYWLDYNNKNTK